MDEWNYVCAGYRNDFYSASQYKTCQENAAHSKKRDPILRRASAWDACGENDRSNLIASLFTNRFFTERPGSAGVARRIL
jgi:hypothetical protein